MNRTVCRRPRCCRSRRRRRMAASDPILAIARTVQARLFLSEAVVCGSPPKQGPSVVPAGRRSTTVIIGVLVSIVRRGRLVGAELLSAPTVATISLFPAPRCRRKPTTLDPLFRLVERPGLHRDRFGGGVELHERLLHSAVRRVAGVATGAGRQHLGRLVSLIHEEARTRLEAF